MLMFSTRPKYTERNPNMDDPHYQELKTQIEALSRTSLETKDNLQRVVNALLGGFDSSSVGLIEQVRHMKLQQDTNSVLVQQHVEQISSLMTFQANMKKIVAGIAIAMPVLFDVLKGIWGLVWEALKTHGPK